MTELAAVAVFAMIVFGLVIFDLQTKIAKERDEWKSERRFLIDRAIARHIGEVLALDRMDTKREHGEEQPREHVPTIPEGL
jgi:hypothetical protein